MVILDEPTSSLANAEADLVAAAVMRLSAAGIAVVYVSHRMNEIRRLASSCTIMRDGRVAGDVALDNTSTQQIVDLMLGHQDHHTQTVTAPKGGDKVLKLNNYRCRPNCIRSVLSCGVAKYWALPGCWAQAAVNC